MDDPGPPGLGLTVHVASSVRELETAAEGVVAVEVAATGLHMVNECRATTGSGA